MVVLSNLSITATSMVSQDDQQYIVIGYHCSRACHLTLSVFRGEEAIAQNISLAMDSGSRTVGVLLPRQQEAFDALWQFTDRAGNVLAQVTQFWKKPREWTLYAMISSHTDIGLHESQYIQREECCKIIDEAMKLCDETDKEQEDDRYRYTMEGSWFWNNYGCKHGSAAAQKTADEYIRTGKIGICSGMAGNHFQTFGLEEMCRSAYERKRLKENWDIGGQTLALIDINGMPASMIHPYVNAGYRNIIFAPNHWNPMRSTVWKNDRNILGPDLNPEAGGYGSRVDVRYASEIPMVYNWENENGEQLTVWASTQYGYGGDAFGFYPLPRYYYIDLQGREDKMWKQLELLESKYPYDLWMFACYDDNQFPDRYLIDHIQEWNARWKWPRVRTLGNPDEPFKQLRERFGDQIPVIKGDMSGGWYQHPLAVPELIAQKMEAERLLAAAEKWSVAACLTDPGFSYPAADFRRAWDHLLFNDEHSYGVSGYSGRRVYETWMQHRDWIEKVQATAQNECRNALSAIAGHISAAEESLVAFNATAQETTQWIEDEQAAGCARVTVPPFGYAVVGKSRLLPMSLTTETVQEPPVVENRYYRICFADNGSICSIFDKDLGRELADPGNAYRINELVFTHDHHQTFHTPGKAAFEITRSNAWIRVDSHTTLDSMGAEVHQSVTLPLDEKRIDIENNLLHVRAMINAQRYRRYLYCAFPFQVENCRRLCHLNGAVVEYAKDVTGHGTDVYMAAHEWCCAENPEFGVALLMKENQLSEFDHIHPDKTDYDNAGDGSQIFAYLANDWLQKHTSGGSHVDYCFRYAITSYSGGYRQASIPEMAERFVTPLAVLSIPAQTGSLPADAHRFLDMHTASRFLCLKRADDGRGVIARFYGESPAAAFNSEWAAQSCTVDERSTSEPAPGYGFATYRLGQNTLRLPAREPEPACSSTPSPIGSVYTGLISEPCAAASEDAGSLYLLWGASEDADLSHYKLYRGEHAGFEADDLSFLADIQPEDYCVGRYVDSGLREHTCYYYRVCAVNTSGVCGPLSREFSAYTREPLFDPATP